MPKFLRHLRHLINYLKYFWRRIFTIFKQKNLLLPMPVYSWKVGRWLQYRNTCAPLQSNGLMVFYFLKFRKLARFVWIFHLDKGRRFGVGFAVVAEVGRGVAGLTQRELEPIRVPEDDNKWFTISTDIVRQVRPDHHFHRSHVTGLDVSFCLNQFEFIRTPFKF
jgi:hypothetical protein